MWSWPEDAHDPNVPPTILLHWVYVYKVWKLPTQQLPVLHVSVWSVDQPKRLIRLFISQAPFVQFYPHQCQYWQQLTRSHMRVSKSRFNLKCIVLPGPSMGDTRYCWSVFTFLFLNHNWFVSAVNIQSDQRSHFTTVRSQSEPWNYLAGLRLLGSGSEAAGLWRETAMFLF